MNERAFKILKTNKGITLVALVVTMVILIILAVISINAMFGENGLITSANRAKLEHQKAETREQIELVLADAFIEKHQNKEKYNENEYLNKFVEERLQGVRIEENEIELNGFIFELDRSVPKLGKYIGQATKPRIKEINVTNETTNSISIEVIALRAEGGKYTYYIKKNNEGEESWKEVKGSNNTCVFNNLETNVVYNIKVRVEAKNGEAEGEINVQTGEMPEGTIKFTEAEWQGDGTAKVTISTTADGYTLQYQIGAIEETGWKNISSGEEITGLTHGQTVYGRLFDGINGTKDDASFIVKDEIKPIVTVTAGTITTNSIAVSVEAQDNESGMKEDPTYTYYIKKTSEGEDAYLAKATDIASNSYTFTGLTQETSYDIKVEVNGDKALNKGIGTLLSQTTKKIGGAEDGLLTGNIVASNPTWSGGKASITLSTSTGLTIQYQVGGIAEGSWKTGTSVTGLNHNDTVYARLTDGTNYGDYASVDIKDTTAPTVTLTKGEVTTKSIAVSVKATDAEWGMPASVSYSYYIKQSNGTYPTSASYTGTNTSYTFNNLLQNTSYDIKVTTTDKAGNIGSKELKGITTGKIGGAEGGLVTGNIVASNPTWSGGKASITLSTNTGLTIQWQKNSISGNWTNGTNVTGLNHNDTVYARLTDGTNYGDYASVVIKDTILPNAPTITLSGTVGTNGWYKSNVTVKITAGSDTQSGANKVRYKVTGAQTVAQTDTSAGTTSATITISSEGTSTITAYTIDKAGNVSSAKTQVVNKDVTAPTATLTVGTKTENSIAVSVSASDTTSGLATYTYYLNGVNKGTAGNSFSFTGLSAVTSYTLKAVVTDKAGNTVTKTVTASTTEDPNSVQKILKAGDYVTYPSSQGDLACRVLYDNSSGYGVQLITSTFVGNDITLGSSDFTTSMNSYNNAISTLNNAASVYNNNAYSTARCVGSNPANPSAEAGMHTTQFSSSYSGKLRDTDENYKTDFEQMKKLSMLDIGKDYWISSRYVNSQSNFSVFYVYVIYSDGGFQANNLCEVLSEGSIRANSFSRGLRPVFILKPTIKVTGGNGTASSPYTLGV